MYLADTTKVGVEKDFYSENGREQEDDLEKRLSEIESNAAPQLRAFREDSLQITPELGRFIAWLAARTTWLRRITQEAFPEYLRSEPELFRKDIGLEKHQFEFENVKSRIREEVSLAKALERVRNPMWRMRVTQPQHLDAIRMQAHIFQYEHLPALKWLKLTAPRDDYFITSDRPVCWDILDIGASDSPAALRHPNVELTFTVDWNHALVAGRDAETMTVRPIRVAEINARVRSRAERFIYGCRAQDIVNPTSGTTVKM